MTNENWTRWIFASASKYFVDTINSKLKIYIEGQEVDVAVNHCEFRLNGTDFEEISKNYHKGTCEINIILNIFKSTNIHQIQKYSGVVQAAFVESINVYRYGKETGDDGTYLGCLKKTSRVENLQLGEFEKLEQSTISASYEIYLDT